MFNDVLAFFITWTCYGTYLPGDERGWTKWSKGDRLPQPLLEDWCRERLSGPPVLLTVPQRAVVEQAIRDHCELRQWLLHAVNCRSNHCHCVVTAPDYSGEVVRDQLKSWSTRRLNGLSTTNAQGATAEMKPTRWWTRKGSVRHLFEERSLEEAIRYVMEAQDLGGSMGRLE